MNWRTCRELDTIALGRLGEDLALGFLKTRGCPILGRNVVLELGEIDILARIDGERTAVEVRSTRSRPDATWPPPPPLAAFDYLKAQQVRRIARFSRCSRIDVISVRFHEGGIDLHWVPKAV